MISAAGSTIRKRLRRTGLLHAIRRLVSLRSRSKARDRYSQWISRYDTLTDEKRRDIAAHISKLRDKLLISIAMPVYNPEPKFLDQAIRSVRNQLYPHWELCIADDASTRLGIREIVERHCKEDSRIKVVYRRTNGNICRATNSATEIASGEFVAFLDHDDLLSEHALYWIAAEINRYPESDIVYSDSDLLDNLGRRNSPYFKSDFDLELLLGHNMISHLGVYRRALVLAAGGMRVGLEGSQDYDLALRILGLSSRDRVRHIPAVLYHWRQAGISPSYSMRNLDQCIAAARRAIGDFLTFRKLEARVLPAPRAAIWQRVEYALPDPPPKVSIIVSATKKLVNLGRCLRDISERTNYPSFDVAVLAGAGEAKRVGALLAEFSGRIQIKTAPMPRLDFSAARNAAAAESLGELILFLDAEVEIRQRDWLQELVRRATQPDIGATGPVLRAANGRIQQAGLYLSEREIAIPAYHMARRNYPGPAGEALLVRETSAISVACMAVQRRLFLDCGGFDPDLPLHYGDVDLCLRLRARGYRNVVTPFAHVVLHVHPDVDVAAESDVKHERSREAAAMRERWGHTLRYDPYLNQNLSLESYGMQLAEPPRVTYPWAT